MDTIAMTPKELTRLQVLALVRDGKLAQVEAAQRLGLSARQVRRLVRRLESGGAKALAHGSRGRSPCNKTSPEVRQRILKLIERPYVGFNDTHLAQILKEREGLCIGRETLRRILRAAGYRPKRRRRPPQHHRRRLRAPAQGLMVLWDGSPHPWFGPNQPPCTLMAALDDADGELLEAFFCPQETSLAYLRLLEGIVRKKGIPASIYQDRHSALKRTDPHWTLAEQLAGQQHPTQVGAALRDLGIQPLFALSPQAKGRVERLFGVLQDRLTAEMALDRVHSIEAANAYLKQHWIERYNRAFQKPAPPAPCAYRSSARFDLNRILAFRYSATVANDNTVSLGGVRFDIPPGPAGRSYAKAKVDIHQHLDGSWSIYYQKTRIAQASPSALREPVRIRRHNRRRQAFCQDFLVYLPNDDLNPADIFAGQLTGHFTRA
jgi:transposase